MVAPGATASELTPTSTIITATPPTALPVDGAWAAFKLDVCIKGTSNCLALAPCVVDGNPEDGTACTIDSGLVQGATYTAVATACQAADCASGATSQPSAPAAEFTVPYE